MLQKIPRVSIEGLSTFNAAWAALCDAVELALNIEGSGNLSVSQGSTGFIIAEQVKEPIWIKLTSAGPGTGEYQFSQVYPASGGGWTVYPNPVTGSAWEFNLTSGILGIRDPFYTKAKWYNTATGGEWRFQAGLCTFIPPLPRFEWYQPLYDPAVSQGDASADATGLSIVLSNGGGTGLQEQTPIPP